MSALLEKAGAGDPTARMIEFAIDAPSSPSAPLREILDALPAAVYATDAAGRITYFNQAAVAFAGREPVIGSDEWCITWKLYWPDGRPMPHAECPMAVTLREGRPVRGAEAIAERPDGTRVVFEPHPVLLYDATGRITGAVNMLVDISSRKQAEESGMRLAAIVESSDDAIISKNLSGVIKSWNKGAERIFGYLAEEIIGLPIVTLIPSDKLNEETAIIERIRRGERIDHYETVRQRKDGALIDVSITVSPIRDKLGVIVGASKIARDITDRKRKEAQFAMLAREAEHRTKNVLATVQAAVQLSESETVEGLKAAISGRIQALANVHALFVQSRWTGADLARIVEQEFAPYSREGVLRATIDGPHALLEPTAAQTFAVTLHELTTNAAKYGALSTEGGRVDVEWSYAANGKLTLRWTESGGPTVKAPPTRKGFGMRVIEAMIQSQPGGEVRLDWRSDGLVCELTMLA
jgi:PAS domain S-box-containing protein